MNKLNTKKKKTENVVKSAKYVGGRGILTILSVMILVIIFNITSFGLDPVGGVYQIGTADELFEYND